MYFAIEYFPAWVDGWGHSHIKQDYPLWWHAGSVSRSPIPCLEILNLGLLTCYEVL